MAKTKPAAALEKTLVPAKDTNATLDELITHMNKSYAALPDSVFIRQGNESYKRSGKKGTFKDEVFIKEGTNIVKQIYIDEINSAIDKGQVNTDGKEGDELQKYIAANFG